MIAVTGIARVMYSLNSETPFAETALDLADIFVGPSLYSFLFPSQIPLLNCRFKHRCGASCSSVYDHERNGLCDGSAFRDSRDVAHFEFHARWQVGVEFSSALEIAHVFLVAFVRFSQHYR